MNLVVVDESGAERRLPIDADRITIGRARDNVVRLFDRFVSRHHAELRRGNDGWVIADVGSKSGTLINRKQIDGPAPVLPGDSVRIGKTSLRLDDSTDGDVSVSISDGDVRRGYSQDVRIRKPGMSSLSRTVADAVRAMISGQPAARTLRHVLEIALDVTEADRGLIALVDKSGELGERIAVHRRGASEIELSRAVLARTLESREAVILREIESGNLRDTLHRHDVRSVLCTPLVIDESVAGVFYLDSIGHRAAFDDSHLEIVSTLAALCGIAIQNAEVRRVAATTHQLEIQLDAAAEIQRKLLPPRDPVPMAGYSAAAWQSMCHAVGGDFYDFFKTSHGYGALLADVAGKRLDGALIMANLHAEWHGVRNSDQHPRDWLRVLNDHMCACLPSNRFITMALAVADPGNDRVLFANAGHNTCFRVGPGAIDRLPSAGLAIGIIPALDFELTELDFRPGERIVLYSDGLTDQLDDAGEPFGEERLVAVLETVGAERPSEIRAHLLEALDRHSGDAPQDDDITIAILGRDAPPS